MLGDLPQWDLSDLYASINDSKLSSDKIEIEELTESFINKYQNKIATLSRDKSVSYTHLTLPTIYSV